MNISVNRYIKSLVVTCILASVLSCNDFLDPKPQTFETKENFFNSDEQFELAVNSAYARLQNWVMQAHFLEEMRSDNTTYDNQLNLGVSQHLARLDWFVPNTDIPQVSNGWNVLFQGIKETNVPLSLLAEAISSGILQEDLGKRMEGELKFLRAFFYFTAVRLWGDVPIVLEPITNGLEAFEIVRSSEDEVFNVIISDLETAIDLLPESYEPHNLGRANKFAAKAILARVHLWNDDYNKAEELLRGIVNSGKYDLLDDYAAIFPPHNKFNSELIFEVGFREGDEGESSNFIFQFAPVGSFPEIIPTLVGDGTWGKNIPTRELINQYEEGDTRFDASIGFFDRPDTENIPYIKKWHEASDPNFARTNHNWPLIRYADILLLLAESINEQGYDTEEPFQLLNQVRTRAGIPSVSTADLPNQESFRRALIKERRIELAFENHRWYDLVRHDLAVEVMREHGTIEISNPTTSMTSILPLDPKAYEVESYMILYPIPQNELIVNPNMSQNQGY